MPWEKKGNLYVMDGYCLRPRSANQVENDNYRLGYIILEQKKGQYADKPPLLIPLMRAGFRTAHSISTVLRLELSKEDEEHADLQYTPIKVGPHRGGFMGSGKSKMADASDLMTALDALGHYDEGIVVDVDFGTGVMLETVRSFLARSQKKMLVATPYLVPDQMEVDRAPDFYVEKFDPVEIEGVKYPCQLIMPWEMDTIRDKKLWEGLFPELKQPF